MLFFLQVVYSGEVDRSELGLFKVEDGLEIEGPPVGKKERGRLIITIIIIIITTAI